MELLLDQIKSNLQQSDVSIVEFVESSEFCNKQLYPGQRVLLKLIFLEELEGWEEDILDHWIAGGRGGHEIEISPMIRERVQYMRDNGFKHFREVQLVGGRRSSKGFVTGHAVAKKMYETKLLQDPGRYYGIDPDKDIYFMCIAGSEEQAKKYQFADVSAAVAGCKAMQPDIVRALETEIRVATAADQRQLLEFKQRNVKMQKDVARIRARAEASNSGTVRGSTSMVIVIDEMALMLEGESKSSASEVYEAVEPSLDQFMGDGLTFLNSSPYTKVGKFYEKYVEGMKLEKPETDDIREAFGDAAPANPMMFTFKFPSWALYEHYHLDPDRRFQNAIMVSPDWDLNERNQDGTLKWSAKDRRGILIARGKEKSNPDKYKVERRANFAEVIDAYLDPNAVNRMFMGRPKPDGDFIPLKTNWTGSSYLYVYRAHLDPSSTTAGFGFALGHTEELTDERGHDSKHVVFDIIKRWDPARFPSGVIEWETVTAETFLWIDIFRPTIVTFDQYQSQNMIQGLQKMVRMKGISGVHISEKTATNEANWLRAETFKTALYRGLVHGPNDTEDTHIATNELKFLQKISTAGRYPRVDKQDIGPVKTKDMADAIMEVTEGLIGNELATETRDDLTNTRIQFGAAGGYPIGGTTEGQVGIANPRDALAQWNQFYEAGGASGDALGANSMMVPLRGKRRMGGHRAPAGRREWGMARAALGRRR